MKNSLPDALENCLKAMEKGLSLEDTLGGTSSLALELRPLLVVAQVAQSRGKTPLELNCLSKNRLRLLARAAEIRGERVFWWRAPFLRTALITCVIVLLLFAGGIGLKTTSASSLPGDMLYGIKRGVENIQFLLVSDPGKRDAIEQQLNAQRITETDMLLQESRVEKVEFLGVLELQTSDGWVISGIPVVITAQTEVEGILIQGTRVGVWGSTQTDGTVLAERIRPVVDDATGNGEDTDYGNPSGYKEAILPELENEVEEDEKDSDDDGDESEDDLEDDTEEDPEDEAEDAPEEDPEDDTEEDPEDDTEEDPEDDTEEDPEDEAEDAPEDEIEDDLGDSESDDSE
jgi:hypothetical protein